MKKSEYRIFKSTVLVFSAVLILLMISCDFKSPADFEMPTWFMDLTIPLIEENYPLDGMVDDSTIVVTSDSLGMQVVFGDDLDTISIDPSYLKVKLNQNIEIPSNSVNSPTIDFSGIDTTITVEIPFAPNGEFVDVHGTTFSVPDTIDHKILASVWNPIAQAFDTPIVFNIYLPQVDESALPEFITIKALTIVSDSDADSSLFQSTIINNGLPTDIHAIEFSLSTDISGAPTVLAYHINNNDLLPKDSISTQYTLLGDSLLGSQIQMSVGFRVKETTLDTDTLTIKANDSVKVNLAFLIEIDGIDSVVVQIAEYNLAPELDPIAFPSDIEIYSGKFTDPSPAFTSTNEIRIDSLYSYFPFDIDFEMKFENFVPSEDGKDSIVIRRTLSRNRLPYYHTFDIDGYEFKNVADPNSPLTNMDLTVSAWTQDTVIAIPLDGSAFGSMSMEVGIDSLHFESLTANLFREFPPAEQEMSGMPSGFTGMAFTDVQIQITMWSQIQFPISLDMDMIGVNTYGDSIFVNVQVDSLNVPTSELDTAKTMIRVSREGTTTFLYDLPGDSIPSDSTTNPPGESTIVDLLSFNPETMVFSSAASIKGRGTISGSSGIWGEFRLIAPFEVKMSPMTFIPINESPLEEWDYELRNKIRSGLRSASAVARVTNHFPVGGDISILLSNQANFPLDESRNNLDSMAAALGIDISAGDSLYVVSECSTLDPSMGADSSIYIFNIMSDFSECLDGVSYFIRSSTSGVDTVVAYIDTLLKIVLPDPTLNNYDSDNDDRRLVDIAGDLVTSSIMDPAKIQLMTSAGDHYTTPRIHLNGSPIDPITGDTLPVFLSLNDYVAIKSFLTFEISSTGMLESAPGELVIQYPNGGESLTVTDIAPIIIRWRTYGKINKVNLDYSTITDPDIEDDQDWTPLESNWTAIDNEDSCVWNVSEVFPNLGAPLDSVRIRVSDADSDISDMSGWYFTLKSEFDPIIGVSSPIGLKSRGRKQ
ncbi:MAG: hypothetical protein HQ528_06930 [Candidatus Marinimicrobia bacterium]|nr:hypothetical protein [Candidatus Neomarinimicrobiota bacterium]